MWRDRWKRVLGLALGIFVINGLSRLFSHIADSGANTGDPSALPSDENTASKVIAVVGVLLVVALVGILTAQWSVRRPFGRVFADVGLGVVGGTILALFIGPFLGFGKPFSEGLASFVGEFLQFLGLGALGLFLGFVAMVALGRDWRTRGLQAYADRYHERHPHRTTRKR
jgi:hypothetical protein